MEEEDCKKTNRGRKRLEEEDCKKRMEEENCKEKT